MSLCDSGQGMKGDLEDGKRAAKRYGRRVAPVHQKRMSSHRAVGSVNL